MYANLNGVAMEFAVHTNAPAVGSGEVELAIAAVPNLVSTSPFTFTFTFTHMRAFICTPDLLHHLVNLGTCAVGHRVAGS